MIAEYGRLGFRLAVAVTGICLMSTRLALADAPRQLYNKTVQINWTTNVTERGPDGQTKNVAIAVGHTVYVSSAGRLFERGSRATAKGRKQSDLAPGDTQNKGGEAVGLRFQGAQLVGNVAFARGARQFVVSFDPGFSSCTVAVRFGRESGGLKRVGVDGVLYTIDSMTDSGESCAVREGNPFTSQ